MAHHVYAGGTLDRVSHLRRDAAWVEAAWQRPDALVAPLWRGQCLVTADGSAAMLPQAVWGAGPRDAHGLPWALLGLDGVDGVPVFTLDMSQVEAPELLLPADAGVFAELRGVTPALPMPQAALLAYARALLDWRRRARFCGMCGAPTEPQQAGHVAVCTACGTQFFPRTDPTVIMLVCTADRVLLGHNARFPGRLMYSTLAGFVEPGESLEEAVAREVMEEAGVRVGAVRYHSSQPWPYPANLMLGFHAEAASEDIVVDADELLDARWFTREELRAPEVHGFELPGAFSIARRLIEDWLHGRAGAAVL